MGEKKKIIITLAVVLSALLIVFVLIDAVYSPDDYKPEIVYPTISLASNYADADTAPTEDEVSEDESLPNTYSFNTVPYTIHVPAGNPMEMGSGVAYQFAKGYLLYLSEYSTKVDAASVIAEQYPSAILPDYILNETKVKLMQSSTGYINTNFSKTKQTYAAFEISVSNDNTQMDSALLGFDIPTNYNGNSIFVGVATTNMNQEDVDKCALILQQVTKTLAYSSDLDSEIQQGISDRDMTEATNEGDDGTYSDTEDGSATEYTTNPAESSSGSVAGVHSWTGDVTEGCTELDVDVSWPNSNPDAVLELIFPDQSAYAVPVDGSQTETSARFVVPSPAAGTYTLNIGNYEACGNIDEISVDFQQVN